MKLYGFGFNGHGQVSRPPAESSSTPRPYITSPELILEDHSIEILWTSWCDSLVALQDPDKPTPTFKYTTFHKDFRLLAARVEFLNGFRRRGGPMTFFGGTLIDGLQGFVGGGNDSSDITIFAVRGDCEWNEEEMWLGKDIRSYSQKGYRRVQNVIIGSGGDVTAILKVGDSFDSTQTSDLTATSDLHFKRFDCMESFEKGWRVLWDDQAPTSSDLELTLPSTGWKSVISNATTTTALTPRGQVYTWASDSRYPKCLGRQNVVDLSDDEGPMEGKTVFRREVTSHIPTPIPYLSETKIIKIASGGYMTAALSEEGELFLWGQACPGQEGELDALKNSGRSRGLLIPEPDTDHELPRWPAGYASSRQHETGMRDVPTIRPDEGLPKHLTPGTWEFEENEEDQDEFVKCVSIVINGSDARIVDVAVGFGHILAAAEVEKDGTVERFVVAAGQGESGQLGVGGRPKFVSKFAEVSLFRGMKIHSLAAAGWTSWAVVEETEV